MSSVEAIGKMVRLLGKTEDPRRREPASGPPSQAGGEGRFPQRVKGGGDGAYWTRVRYHGEEEEASRKPKTDIGAAARMPPRKFHEPRNGTNPSKPLAGQLAARTRVGNLPMRQTTPRAATVSHERPLPLEQATLQGKLRGRMRALPGVVEAFVPVLDLRTLSHTPENPEGGSSTSFEDAFAFLLPNRGDEWFLVLPWDLSDEVVAKGWGEVRPVLGDWGNSPITTAVHGPRDARELAILWPVFLASYEFRARAAQPVAQR